MSLDPYSVLGVERDADAAAVKRAYRKAAQAAHPDRHGGDTTAMTRVNVARDILSDPQRRERYDLGGEDVPATPALELRARVVLAQVFQQFVAHPQRLNIVSQSRSALSEMRRKQVEALAEMKRTIERMRQRLKDVEYLKPSDGPDLFADTVAGAIANLEHQTQNAQEQLEAIGRALELLKGYTSAVMEQPQFGPVFTSFR